MDKTNDSDSIRGASYIYKFVGQGAQFRVYAMHQHDGSPTGRVIKVPITLAEIEYAVAPHAHTNPLQPYETLEQATRLIVSTLLMRRQLVPKLLEGVNGSHRDLMQALGDMRVLPRTFPQPADDSGNIVLPVFCTQRQVAPLVSYLEVFRFSEQYPERLTTSHITQIEYILRETCRLHLLLWEYGFFELSFNLRNFGVYDEQTPVVTLLDIGEVITDVHQAKERMTMQPWLYNVNAIKRDYPFLPTVLHEMYKKMCNEYFTPELLAKKWEQRKLAFEERQLHELRKQELTADDSNQQVFLWVKQQTLSQRLYRGMQGARMEQVHFEIADLRLLQNDIRLKRTLFDTHAEYAERGQASQTWQPEPFHMP